jgi:hypothetical protein
MRRVKAAWQPGQKKKPAPVRPQGRLQQGDSLHVFILSALEQLISCYCPNEPGQEEGNQE